MTREKLEIWNIFGQLKTGKMEEIATDWYGYWTSCTLPTCTYMCHSTYHFTYFHSTTLPTCTTLHSFVNLSNYDHGELENHFRFFWGHLEIGDPLWILLWTFLMMTLGNWRNPLDSLVDLDGPFSSPPSCKLLWNKLNSKHLLCHLHFKNLILN